MTFADGSKLSWESKETLIYEKDNQMVSVWFDFGPGLFSKKRIVKMSSLKNWQVCPIGITTEISSVEAADIVSKIKVFCPKLDVEIELDG